MEDFWIGDLVFDEKSGLQGKYEGKTKQNEVRLNVLGKTYLLREPRLRAMNSDEQDSYAKALEMELPKTLSPTTGSRTYSNFIDLHIEKIAPLMSFPGPEAIIHRQISTARQFIEESIQKRQYQILIIHGKGTGALKMEIDMLLHEFPNIYDSREMNEGGATLVFLKYPVSW